MMCHIGKLVLITMACAVLAHAQSKVAFIDSSAFLDEKAGIAKFVGGVKALNDEFKPDQAALKAISDKMQLLDKEIISIRDLAARDPKLVDPKSAQAKMDEAENLKRDFNRKSEDIKFRFDRSQQTRLGPIQQAIMKGLQDYAKEKGYTLIFDIAKDQNGLLIAIGDQTADVTKDFIAFYNAKP